MTMWALPRYKKDGQSFMLMLEVVVKKEKDGIKKLKILTEIGHGKICKNALVILSKNNTLIQAYSSFLLVQQEQ